MESVDFDDVDEVMDEKEVRRVKNFATGNIIRMMSQLSMLWLCIKMSYVITEEIKLENLSISTFLAMAVLVRYPASTIGGILGFQN